MRSTDRKLATVVLLTLVSLSSACRREDLEALLSIMNSFPPDSFPPSWNPHTSDCCTWDYVSCGDGAVTKLIIINNGQISGTIPPAVGSLSGLQVLLLNSLPGLVGPIPRELGRLADLRSLEITFTGISGPVPAFLSNLTKITSIDLNYNKLSGPIPASLGDLEHLSFITLMHNRLTGAIPSTLFGRCKNCSFISLLLSRNALAGDIPPSFGGVPFYLVDLSDNDLTGDASFLLGKSKRPNAIVLARNRLAFDLTDVEYPELNLKWLDISHNEIYGGISEQINRADDMISFDASYNRLCGKIPSGKVVDRFSSSAFSHNDCLWRCAAAPSQLKEDVARAPVLT